MNIEYIFNSLSKELVWEKTPAFYKKGSLNEFFLGERELFEEKVYGLGIGYKKKEYTLDFFISSDFDKRPLESIIRQKGVYLHRNYILSEGFFEFSDSTQKISAGEEVKHIKLSGYGTLGGFMHDKLSESLLAISNNHVFALYNKGKINDSLIRNIDNSQFGKLLRFVDLKKPPNINTVDIAAGIILKDQKIDYGWRKPIGTSNAVNRLEVYKIGAKTGYTEGIITNTNFNLTANYNNLGYLNFTDCLAIRGKNGRVFSAPGDSGSFVFTKNHKLIGIIFAGNERENISFANKISNIENELKVYL